MSRLEMNQNEGMEELMQAILSIKDMEQCRAFFSDLCTVQELKAFSQRLQVAKRLLEGQTYERIRSEVGVSSATITRISAELQFGAGGYSSVISALQEKDKQL